MSFPAENLSTVEDFLENESFRIWVTQQRPEDQLYWQQWLANHPDKAALYEQAVVLLLTIQGQTTSLTDEHVFSRTQHILDQADESATPIMPLRSWHWGRWASAAAVVAVLIWWQLGAPVPSSVITTNRQHEQGIGKETWKIVKNTTGQPQVVLLPDNSSVLLSTGSQLRFRKQTGRGLREVFLQGEGFFEVTKNPTRPFVVYTASLTTKVLGTSFQVRSFEKEGTTVVKVKTGKVSVTPVSAPEKPVLLTVNEQLSLETKTETVVKKTRNPAEEDPSVIVNQAFTFEYAPVPDILAQLEASYHMPIRYDRDMLKNCTFTGQLNDMPFLEKIRLVCLTIESTFDVAEGQIIIHSRGCD